MQKSAGIAPDFAFKATIPRYMDRKVVESGKLRSRSATEVPWINLDGNGSVWVTLSGAETLKTGERFNLDKLKKSVTRESGLGNKPGVKKTVMPHCIREKLLLHRREAVSDITIIIQHRTGRSHQFDPANGFWCEFFAAEYVQRLQRKFLRDCEQSVILNRQSI